MRGDCFLIHSGRNTIHLGTNENPGSIKWTFEVDEELENKEQSLITLNQTNHFEHTAPHILLNNIQTNPASEIWWQISPDAEFKTIPSNLEQVEPFVSEINFLPITQTFFNSDDTYYFRVKG